MHCQILRRGFKLTVTRWRYRSIELISSNLAERRARHVFENHSSLLQNVGRTFLMILTHGILNGSKVSSFIRSILSLNRVDWSTWYLFFPIFLIGPFWTMAPWERRNEVNLKRGRVILGRPTTPCCGPATSTLRRSPKIPVLVFIFSRGIFFRVVHFVAPEKKNGQILQKKRSKLKNSRPSSSQNRIAKESKWLTEEPKYNSGLQIQHFLPK